jgi:recombination protein RecR
VLFAKPLADLIAEFEKLPGVGPKSAQRLAFHLLKQTDHEVDRLADVILTAKRKLRFCEECQNISESPLCEICRDPRRDQSIICVVGEARDIAALERIHEYKGKYHVLHGLLSPMDGIGPEQIRVRELVLRLQRSEVAELIVATNPTIEGDATALYLAKLLKPSGIRITRLAQGMAVGGELDYADSATLLSALSFRREM